MPTIVVFSGTRDIDTSEGSAAAEILERELGGLPRDAEVVHGDSGNVDKATERIARRLGLLVRRFPANWQKYGKRAGPIRNSEMAALKPARWVVLWNGVSPGSRDALAKARLCGAEVAEYIVASASLQEQSRDYWIAVGERIAELKVDLALAKRRRRQLDYPLFVRLSDEPREERHATPEEVSQWQEGADAIVAELERQIAALRAAPEAT